MNVLKRINIIFICILFNQIRLLAKASVFDNEKSVQAPLNQTNSSKTPLKMKLLFINLIGEQQKAVKS